MLSLGDRLTVTSDTFPRDRVETILRGARPFYADVHVLYPADERGQHLGGFFDIEPVASHREFVDWIREDVGTWIDKDGIDFDVVFAPAQRGVLVLAEALAKAEARPVASWEYLPSGRFGTRLVDGTLERGARALVFNGVSHTGRCVGERLPEFVRSLGGTTVGAAVFVKGTAPKVRETEQRMGAQFHSILQARIPVYSSAECPMCAATHEPPIPWTSLGSERMP
jgi:orotate phosphoribosyltransferase